MSTSLWSPEPINLEEASLVSGRWRCLFGDVAWVAFDMGFESTTEQPRPMQRRRVLVAPDGHKYLLEGISARSVSWARRRASFWATRRSHRSNAHVS